MIRNYCIVCGRDITNDFKYGPVLPSGHQHVYGPDYHGVLANVRCGACDDPATKTAGNA